MSSPTTFVDYSIRKDPNGDLVIIPSEDWPTELLDKELFQAGDVFCVSHDGTLVKMDKLTKWFIQGKWDGCSTTN